MAKRLRYRDTIEPSQGTTMFISGSALASLSSTYNFKDIDPLQIQQAYQALETAGVLTDAEAEDLSALGSASSFSFIGQYETPFSDTSWEKSSINLLSSLQFMVDSPEDQTYGPIGQQVADTEESLLQALTVYQNEHPEVSGSVAQPIEQSDGSMSGLTLGHLYRQDVYASKSSQQALDLYPNGYSAMDKNSMQDSAQAKNSTRGSNVNLSA